MVLAPASVDVGVVVLAPGPVGPGVVVVAPGTVALGAVVPVAGPVVGGVVVVVVDRAGWVDVVQSVVVVVLVSAPADVAHMAVAKPSGAARR